MYYMGALEKNFVKQKFVVRSFLSLYPNLFFPLVKLIGKQPNRAVEKDTEIVIEGFPRSANSFSIGAFEFAQRRPVRLASHLHAPAQIIRAVHLSIPTLVLIRKPVDAVISFKSLELEVSDTNSYISPGLSISLKNYLKFWISFYTRIKPYKDYYVIGLFDEVIQDFGLVIEKINSNFNTNFFIFEHTENNVKNIHAQQGFHSGPSKKRQYLKAILMKEVENDQIKSLIVKANAVYREFEIFANR